MSEELRILLERAVPEAPEIRADGVAERAAAVRRRQVVAGGTALAVVAVAVVGGIALRGSDDDPGLADDVPTAPSGSTAPYDVPVCPVRLPELGDANLRVPNLDQVVAIRTCPDLLAWDQQDQSIDPGARESLADDDALIQVELFRQGIAALPRFDPERCAMIDIFNSRQSLMFVMADGSTDLVATPACWSVSAEGRPIDGGFLATAYLTALDEQRDELAYTRPFRGTPCITPSGSDGPAKPGREELVSAAYCGGKKDPVQLDDEQLAMLRAAWNDPQPVTEQLNEHGENDCTEGGDGTAIYAGTDRSDIVRLVWSPCDFLFWDGWRPDQNAAIPITLEKLGLR